MLCIAVVALALFAAFVWLAMPIEPRAAVHAVPRALLLALPFVGGWVVVAALVLRWTIRKRQT
jgi:hypothetical protein